MATALKIITSTSRPGRQADKVLPWLTRSFTEDERFDVEVLDLRDWRLPLFQEGRETIGDPADPTYSDPLVRAWNRKIVEGSAFVFLTDGVQPLDPRRAEERHRQRLRQLRASATSRRRSSATAAATSAAPAPSSTSPTS